MAAAAAVFAGAAAAAAIPLPEHPRPDWERPQWMNLNGRWDFGFSEGAYDMEISVPFGWGSPLSGVKDVKGRDTGFYRRKVTVPHEWKGKRVFMVVGAADHDTEFRFDGKVVGTHSGGYTPFEFEITGMVRWGAEQTAEFKIWDPDSSFANGGRHLFGKQEYGNVRGIWQTVYLEARGKDYIDSARFTPCIAKSSVKAELRLASPAGGPLVAEVALDGKTARVPFAKGESAKSVDIALASPRLWDLDSPELYDVTLTLGDDTVKTYFGFREVGVGKNANGDPYVTLNGRPVYLQMCLDQSYHPEGYYTFPTDESMKNEIMISKKLALSGNRVHIKVEVPRKLYWADRLGLLIQADVPNAWGPACDGMFAEHWKCFEGMVKRDFNHPSIYQWTLFNETWGLLSERYGKKGGKYMPATQRRVADAYRRAKALDPTRLVDDNSACLRDHVATDVNTWHRYCPAYGWYDKLERVCAKTYPGSKCNYAKGHAQNGAPMMNAECGNVWGYHGSTGDCDFTWDYHAMINAFRSHLKCGGWLYTEHHDVIVEWNGYVREDRTWKETGLEELAGMTLADFHGKAALFMQKRRGCETGEIVRPGEKVVIPVGVSFVTGEFAGKKLALSKSAWWFDGAGRKVSAGATQEKGMFPAKSWQCEKLWDVEFVAPEGPACGCVVFDLMADGERIARNFWSFSTVANDAAMPKPKAAEWSEGTSEVMGGLKLNGFGKGWFEYEVAVPPQGGTFRAELSAKRKNWKDCKGPGRGIDYPAGKRTLERSKNPNSYPQTCEHKFPANLTVSVGGKVALKRVLPDDPADHRGLLSWLAQPHDGRLREAGSYGWLVEVDIPPEAVKDGKATIRLESDAGLAVYGPRFGRYPLGPSVSAGMEPACGVRRRVRGGDPFIHLENGMYYLYFSSGDTTGLTVYTSTDLKEWLPDQGRDKSGRAYANGNGFGSRLFWAPEMHKYKGKYYLFHSAEEKVTVEVGDSPLGPFRNPEKKPFFPEGNIDNSFFLDDDGTPYMLYAHFNAGNEVWICELEKDLLHAKPETQRKLIRAEEDWEMNRADPRFSNRSIAEGPCLVKKDGLYWLTYSSHHVMDDNYNVCLATATDVKGPYVKQGKGPILAPRGKYRCTGHHSLFKDKSGTWKIVFHTRDPGGGPRYTCTADAKFTTKDGHPWIDIGEFQPCLVKDDGGRRGDAPQRRPAGGGGK